MKQAHFGKACVLLVLAVIAVAPLMFFTNYDIFGEHAYIEMHGFYECIKYMINPIIAIISFVGAVVGIISLCKGSVKLVAACVVFHVIVLALYLLPFSFK